MWRLKSDRSGLCHYGVGMQMLKSDSSGLRHYGVGM